MVVTLNSVGSRKNSILNLYVGVGEELRYSTTATKYSVVGRSDGTARNSWL